MAGKLITSNILKTATVQHFIWVKIPKLMTTSDRITNLKFIIERFDNYYDSINNKANLYLTITTFFFAGTITGFYTIDSMHHFSPGMWVFLFVPAMLCNITSFSYTIRAINPFLRKHSTTNSLMFFADVNDYSESSWSEKWKSSDDSSWVQDLEQQAHLLAKGLQIKYSSLSCATVYIAAQVAIFFIFSIIFFLNYKLQ
jgi:hypothetical protein